MEVCAARSIRRGNRFSRRIEPPSASSTTHNGPAILPQSRMDNKPSRASAGPPPAAINPSVIQSTRKMVGVDLRYFTSIVGILKIAEICIGIICAAICGPAYYSGNQFFLFVTITCIIITTVLLLLHFARIPKLFGLPGGIRWTFVEFVYAVTACIFYLIAASVQVARTAQGDYFSYGGSLTSSYNRYMAAGVIAFVNFILYGVDAFFHYKEYRDNRLQGPV
ncbi:hypothetical protein BV898_02582 [Hypsibius exemplaris]|uniref:MARVEL domain-containing protein n=1 Tax=Hypsibius exemplaris TaxID=2072580 RepID=A0A1W0X815_HYPEX|nr:hypothetical protein BV898_02582 [Hypsibius exemplaris]